MLWQKRKKELNFRNRRENSSEKELLERNTFYGEIDAELESEKKELKFFCPFSLKVNMVSGGLFLVLAVVVGVDLLALNSNSTRGIVKKNGASESNKYWIRKIYYSPR